MLLIVAHSVEQREKGKCTFAVQIWIWEGTMFFCVPVTLVPQDLIRWVHIWTWSKSRLACVHSHALSFFAHSSSPEHLPFLPCTSGLVTS